MAYGNWDKIFETFQRAVGHARYGKLAEQMLQMSTQVRPQIASLEASGFVPGTSLLTFCLWGPGSGQIDIIWEEGDLFEVRLMKKDCAEEASIVPMKDVAQTIQRYAQKITPKT